MEGAMARPLTVIALLIAIVGLIFHLAHIAGDIEPLLMYAAFILFAIGVLTGK